MVNEHNPVALLIYKMQAAWIEQISSQADIGLIRWLIKPQDISFYKGFIQLEITEHGKVPEGFHVLFTPFTNEFEHSRQLMQHFCESIKTDIASLEKLNADGLTLNWNIDEYLLIANKSQKSHDEALLKMLKSYKEAIPFENTRIVLTLIPNTVYNYSAYKRWLKNVLKIGLPKGVCLLVFDDEANNYLPTTYFDSQTSIINFNVPVDLDNALRKAATSSSGGKADNSVAAFNDYLFKMGDAVKENNQNKLNDIAVKAIEFAKSQTNLLLQATVYIIHAGMLLSFKDYELMERQLNTGLGLTKKGIELKNESCKPLIVQFYAYLAMLYFHKKQFGKSIEYLMIQATSAQEVQLYSMAISAYRQAEYLAENHNYRKEQMQILREAYELSKKMTIEDLRYTEFIQLGYEWFLVNAANKSMEKHAQEIDSYMKSLYEQDWVKKAKQFKSQLQFSKDAAKAFSR